MQNPGAKLKVTRAVALTSKMDYHCAVSSQRKPHTVANALKKPAWLARLRQNMLQIKPYATRRNALLAGGAIFSLIVVFYAAAFFWPRTVQFSYSADTCITNPAFLPKLISQNQSSSCAANPRPSLSLGGYPLYSHTTCINMIQAPEEHGEEVINLGAKLLAKRIKVKADAFPAIANQAALDSPIPTRQSFVLKLDTQDKTFDYQLLANDKTADCQKQDDKLSCATDALELTESERYNFVLQRLFRGDPVQQVFSREMTTVEPVFAADSSIRPDQTVYEKPDSLTLNMNREVTEAEGARVYKIDGENQEERREISTETDVEGAAVTVRFDEPLERQAAFVLEVERIAAADGGALAEPFLLPFKTSGGPQVQKVNIGHRKAPRGEDIILTFDAPVSREQDLSEFVKFEVNGGSFGARLNPRDNTLAINPSGTLPRCAPLTIRVLDGLENEFGVAGGSAWEFKSLTLCQEVAHIGISVQGRPIRAYHFGTGDSKILFVGGMHGNEKSSVRTLTQWIDELEANPGRIPSHREIIVVPDSNPDGFAGDERYNANNVYLNRNFPTHDWKPDVTFGDGTRNPTGGGTHPLSEPESKALAEFTLRLNPKLVLTYHSIAGFVIPNSSGDSDAQARAYAQSSDLRYASHDQTGELFPYDTSGAYEDWLHQKHDIPALLLELQTRANNEFPAHKNALWRMAELP